MKLTARTTSFIIVFTFLPIFSHSADTTLPFQTATATTSTTISCSVKTTPYNILTRAKQVNKLKALGTTDSISSYLDLLFEISKIKAILNGFEQTATKAQEYMLWTGKKGSLIEVTFRKGMNEAPSTFNDVAIVGYGACAYDVLVSEYGKDKLRKLSEREIDQDDSFYIWLPRNSSKIPPAIVAPGSRGALLASAQADSTSLDFINSQKNSTNTNVLIAMATEAGQREKALEKKMALENIALELKKNSEIKQNIENALLKEIQKQNNISAARKWIDTLSGVLTAAELGLQAIAMLGPDIDKNTEHSVHAAKNPNEIKNVLEIYEKTLESEISKKSGTLTIIDRVEMQLKRTIIDSAKDNGAPIELENPF